MYPLRPGDSGAPGREPVIQEYETVPAERTEDKTLGAYVLVPENIRNVWEEELAEKRLDTEYARAARFTL